MNVIYLVHVLVVFLPPDCFDQNLALILIKGHLLLGSESPSNNSHKLHIPRPPGNIAQQVIPPTFALVSERMPWAPSPICLPLPQLHISAALIELTIIANVLRSVSQEEAHASG